MKKVKFVTGSDYEDLQKQLNDYLDSIGDAEAKINYENIDKFVVIVEHTGIETRHRCCDCQFYDPSEDYRGAWGLCHRRGMRTKFNTKKCDTFIDIRA